MAKGLRFKDAEKARDEITNDQLKRISKLYNDWADDIAKKAEKLKRKGTMSSELQERQMKELEQALRKASEQVANDVTKTLKNGMTKICQSVIAENADWMESLGFPKDVITAAFSSVPDNVVRNIVTGKIYDSGWSLSQSIWGDNEDTLEKIHEIVAGGMAENKPIYDIAKDLEQYVRPDARKQWNLRTESGKMIYPKKVDYNAQRLARTLSQHAYQQTIKTTSTENPFIQKVKWHSSGNHVCEICKKRNGKVFPIDKLPMDHPNGFCIMEQLVDDNIDDRLIDWVNGKEDKDLDKFAKKLGFSVDDMNVKGAEDEISKLTKEFEKVKAEYEKANEAIQEAMMKGDVDTIITLSQNNATTMKRYKELSERIESLKSMQSNNMKREGGHLTKDDFFEGLDKSFLDAYNQSEDQSNRESIGAKLAHWCGEGYTEMKHDYLLEKAISENKNKFEGILYRGMSVGNEILESMQPGAEFLQNGLTSWSSKIDSAMEFAYENQNPVLLIDVTDGPKNAVSIKDFSGRPWENEVLSSGKTKFKVVKRYKKTVEYKDRNAGNKTREVVVIEVEEVD